MNAAVEWCVCRVADSGPGIPAKIRSRIFEPFFTTKPVGQGTGVGLSVCHGMVVSHGGTIEVENNRGGGARFVVRLPAASQEMTEARRSGGTTAMTRGRRALVVDDEPGVAETLRDMLQKIDFRVDISESAHAALERINVMDDFAIVFSDMRMPDMDGIAFHQAVKEAQPLAGRSLCHRHG